MKIKGLDGREYNWKLTGHTTNEETGRSSYHLRCRRLLKKLFQFDRILEELFLPGTDRLRLDFFLPPHRLGVEVHGEQHYKSSVFLHGGEAGFYRALKRDCNKELWCELNNIRLVVLPHWEDDHEWTARLCGNPSSDETEGTG